MARKKFTPKTKRAVRSRFDREVQWRVEAMEQNLRIGQKGAILGLRASPPIYPYRADQCSSCGVRGDGIEKCCCHHCAEAKRIVLSNLPVTRDTWIPQIPGVNCPGARD